MKSKKLAGIQQVKAGKKTTVTFTDSSPCLSCHQMRGLLLSISLDRKLNLIPCLKKPFCTTAVQLRSTLGDKLLRRK